MPASRSKRTGKPKLATASEAAGPSAAELTEFDVEHTIADTELVIGLAAAVGTDLDAVCEALGGVLAGFDYSTQEIRLSALLDEIDWDQELVAKPLDEHIRTYMDGGLELRRRWGRNDALALLAVTKLVNERRELDGSGARRAWILRSLKRPEEVQALRDVYGSHFVLLGAYTPDDKREEWLTEKIRKGRSGAKSSKAKWREVARKLIARDEDERDQPHGQRLLHTFHLADFFVQAIDGVDLEEDPSLRRIFEILFGNPFRTPTKDEFGLFQAAAASRLSVELGRQVGAALTTRRGELLAVGSNEVPRPGGGPYWEDDDDPGVPDAREFCFEVPDGGAKFDTINIFKREIADEIATALKRTSWVEEGAPAEELLKAIESTRLGDVTEFGRAVHAEMAAILDAARNGHAIAGATLYADTFPCHNCARHIVAAGVTRVVYVSPYAKSQAQRLHSDALSVASRNAPEHLVKFEPFVGVAPRRYMELFSGLRRKHDDGSLVTWSDTTATPRFPDTEPPTLRQNRPAYRVHENLVSEDLREVQFVAELWVSGAFIGPHQDTPKPARRRQVSKSSTR